MKTLIIILLRNISLNESKILEIVQKFFNIYYIFNLYNLLKSFF